MSLPQLVLAQLQDPFRIALLIGLVITMIRTRAQTGTLVPLAAGVVFVAVIIPSTLGTRLAEPFWMQVGAGLIANAAIVAVLMGVYETWRRIARR